MSYSTRALARHLNKGEALVGEWVEGHQLRSLRPESALFYGLFTGSGRFFASLLRCRSGTLASVLFDGFTVQGRRVLELAQQEACQLGHYFTGTGHLLLGLIHDETTVGTHALASMGADPDTVRIQVSARLGPAVGRSPGWPPFTERAQEVLGFFVAQTAPRGLGYIGPEHLLFGLLTESDGDAALVLRGMGLDLNAARARMLPMLGGICRTAR